MKPRSDQPNALSDSTPPRKYARTLRVVAWNAAFIIFGTLLIALAGEAYFRVATPFANNGMHYHFADRVGGMLKPNIELRWVEEESNSYVISRTNSQGFLDREPISPARAAAGCHIAFIGDSFVEARQAPISDKFHVRLEKMAARELPHLAITTQAYGMGGTGQINQIPYYDEYARHLSPKLVVLVFFLNDFLNNSSALQSLGIGSDPDRMPLMFAQRDADGTMRLRPPDPEYQRYLLPRLPRPWHLRVWGSLSEVSRFAKWMNTKWKWADDADLQLAAWAGMIAERPCCASLLDGWQPAGWQSVQQQFKEEHLPPAFQEALEYTAFGVEQFKRRTDRDGARLAILSATDLMGTRGDPQFDRLSAIAEASGIPVMSDYDYIVRQGYNAEDGILRFDGHWNATGHRWVAEAILEYLKANQDVCD